MPELKMEPFCDQVLIGNKNGGSGLQTFLLV